MAYTDKVNNNVKTIKNIEKQINDLNENYGKKIKELNDSLDKLHNNTAEKSAHYISIKTAKIQKKYNDIVKGFNKKLEKLSKDANNYIDKKIKELETPVSGEVGSQVGLPPEASTSLAKPILSALTSTLSIKIPNIQLPELEIPETKSK